MNMIPAVLILTLGIYQIQANVIPITSTKGCVQGAVLMPPPVPGAGVIPPRPRPCPAWVNERGDCFLGDMVLTKQQCIDMVGLADYNSFHRGNPSLVD